MGSDAEALRAVMSWACGFLTLAILGAAVPLFLSFLPDAIHLWRRQGEPRPALVDLGVVIGLTVIAGYEVTLTGAPGTPAPRSGSASRSCSPAASASARSASPPAEHSDGEPTNDEQRKPQPPHPHHAKSRRTAKASRGRSSS